MNYLKKKYSENKIQALAILFVSVLALSVLIVNSNFGVISASPPGVNPFSGNAIGNGLDSSSSIFTGVEVSECGVLNRAFRHYSLTSDVNFDSEECFTVTGRNVVFDCSGYSITGTSGGIGINVLADGVIVRDCHVDVGDSSSGENYAIHAENVKRIKIFDFSTQNSYKGILFDGVTDSLISGFYSDGDYKSLDLISGSSGNTVRDMVAANPLDIGIHLTGGSSYNNFEDIEIYGALYGVYVRTGGRDNIFRNLYSHHNELRGLVLSAAGTNNQFIDSVFDHQEYGTKINGAPNVQFINVIFSNSEVQHVFSASGANDGLTFINTKFIDGDFDPDYDLRISYFGDGSMNGLTVIDTAIKNYIFTEFLIDFKYGNNEFGEVVFDEVTSAEGSGLFEEVNVEYNLVQIDDRENPSFDSQATVTLFNLPGEFKNPAIMRNGEVCTDCVALTDLNDETVIFETPGAGDYSIGEFIGSASL